MIIMCGHVGIRRYTASSPRGWTVLGATPAPPPGPSRSLSRSSRRSLRQRSQLSTLYACPQRDTSR
jgi:hypothetical protein